MQVGMLKRTVRGLLQSTALMALILSVALYAFIGIFRPSAATTASVSITLAISSMLLFACAGQMIVITSGDGIDLSVGAVMSTTAVIAVETMNGREEMLLPALLICLAAGFAFGLLNGLGVAYIGIPALIMTLCLANVLGRFQLVISKGMPRGKVAVILTDSLTAKYSVTSLLPDFLPGITVWAALFYLVVVVFLKYTKYGYRLSLIGTNFAAARLSGMNAKRARMAAYAIGGMLSGLGGFIGAGYYRQMQAGTFDHYTMQSIAAVVIGGTLLSGGKANFLGTVCGALLLTTISQFLTAFSTSPAVRYIIMGAILVVLLIAYNRKPKVRQ
ncbi:MAG: ABC transporter permease [Clostridia bacterium]|nr:ABC transporter permease [Clostridia bacterium]